MKHCIRRHLASAGVTSLVLVAALFIIGCAPDDLQDATANRSVAAGSVEVVIDGLVRPTQLFVANDFWLVAQLAGAENDQLGQVLAIDPAQPDRLVVLVEGLDKPTGVAWFGGSVWVMEAARLLRFDIAVLDQPVPPQRPEDAVVIAGPLPNNGRSEGTLSVVGDTLLFDTSGALDNGEVVAGSGRLWSVDEAGAVVEVASGFKHAYAHVGLADGSLLVTEVSDGRFDGELSADAVLRVMPGTDHGWPRCIAKSDSLRRSAVREFGGTTGECEAAPPLLASFDVGATPTSVALIPWDTSRVAVALWNRGEVVAVSLETGEVSVLLSQTRPQHLVDDGSRLLMVDHDEGRIYALTG